MCYGHWMQCSFMSGPPAFGRRDQPDSQKKSVITEKDLYEIPNKCTRVSRDHEISVFALEYNILRGEEDMGGAAGTGAAANGSSGSAVNGSAAGGSKKADEITAGTKTVGGTHFVGGVRRRWERKQMSFADRGVIFGSATDLEGQVLNRDSSVERQHCALLHNQGKLFLKPINGLTKLLSVPHVHELLSGPPGGAGVDGTTTTGVINSGTITTMLNGGGGTETGKNGAGTSGANGITPDADKNCKSLGPTTLVENQKKIKCIDLAGNDKLRKLTRGFCCFQLGDSSTIYYVEAKTVNSGSNLLPLGDDEYDPILGASGGADDRDYRRASKDERGERGRRDEERDRDERGRDERGRRDHYRDERSRSRERRGYDRDRRDPDRRR
ncbi:unnamed protein product [Amoebophrya sp. A25]|nr:unnamed protein product [Amoebophrya sp. A25]|eukprot:GSA25T00004655001.1